MITQQKVILENLEEQGWEIVVTQDSNLEWWADKVWLIKSQNANENHLVYLIFVVDPQADSADSKDQDVWAITASLGKPMPWSKVTLSLGRGWQKNLSKFLVDISVLHREPIYPPNNK